MKALTIAGIEEKSLTFGTMVNWWSKDWGMMGDPISFIERSEDGETITRIAFGSWGTIFTNRMKLGVELGDGATPYKNPMAQVGYWYAEALKDGRVPLK